MEELDADPNADIDSRRLGRPQKIAKYLVLEHNMIVRILSSLVGASIGAIFVFAVTWLLGAIFGPLYNSEEDMTRNLMLFLGACFAFVIMGGLLGNLIYEKHTTIK